MGHIPAEVWKAIKPLFFTLEREVAVVVWKDGTFEELANLHPDPATAIIFTGKDKKRLRKNPDVLAVLHSHPSGLNEPSDADSAGQMAMGVPWGIVAIQSVAGASTGLVEAPRFITGISDPECWGDGVEIPPLLGRTYLWNIRDCFDLVRDYYRLQGRTVPQAARSRAPGTYALPDPRARPFTSWAPLCGFVEINERDRKAGDTCVMHMPDYSDPDRMNWPRSEPNHCAIYLGQGKYIHQLRDTVSDYWTPKDEDTFLKGSKAQFYRLKEAHARTRRPARST